MVGFWCSFWSKKVVSDVLVDYVKMILLNLLVVFIVLGLVFFLDDIIGFEIMYLFELFELYSFLFIWFVVLFIMFLMV